MGTYIVSVDLGTTSMKTVLFDSFFAPIASVQKVYETTFPQSGWAEQSPDMWWDTLCKAVSELIEGSGISAEEVSVIGVDSMSSAMVALDADGSVLRPAMLWMDRRSQKECERIDETFGSKFFTISGNHNDPSNFGPKTMWFKEHEPGLYERTAVLLHANGFLVYRLTGKATMDVSECGLSQLCKSSDSAWSDELLEGCGIDRDRLPEIVECTTIVGSVTRRAAELTGLAAGTPVVAGSMDNVAAGVGAGLYQQHDVYISAGTVTTVNSCISSPEYNEHMHLYRHAVPGRWLSVAGVDYGGAGLRWFKEILESDGFEKIDSLAEDAATSSASPIFFPYMVGQRAPLWNSDTRGVLYGLSPSVSKGELLRSLMEGNVLGVRRIFDELYRMGVRPAHVRLTGGCANSSVWSSIFADVLDKEILIPGAGDVASLGAAMIAAVGVGLYENFEEAAQCIPIRISFSPDESKKKLYAGRMNVFNTVYERLEDTFSLFCSGSDEE